MFTKVILHATVALAALSAAGAASAAVLVDRLPTATSAYFYSFENNAVRQNLMVQVTFAQDVELTGFSLMTDPNFSNIVNRPVTFKLRESVADAPAATNLFRFDDTIESVTPIQFSNSTTGYVSTTNFAPIAVAAGTYFIGLSGATTEIGWAAFDLGSPVPPQYFLGGEDVFSRLDEPGEPALGFSVQGNVLAAAVPEPATWAMMIAGFGLVGSAMRRRKVAVSFA